MEFVYCPVCGRKLVGREIGDEGETPFCEECNRPWFGFSYPCVICLVTDGEGSFALIKQSYVSQNHVCVAGHVKSGETLEQTAVREVEEETGLSVRSAEYLGSWFHSRGDNLMAGFAVTVEHGEFSLSCEVDSAEWYDADMTKVLLSKGSVGKELLREYLSKH